jgi:tryptophanyl-tRNA synthetase
MTQENNKKKVLVSGIQSSGKLHIGNYFGAMKQNIELGNSDEYESYVFIADYHSMTSLTNGKERAENTLDAACAYLACGLDPVKQIFFKQSDVSKHTELAWILSTITPIPMLELAHSYKDKQNKNHEVNAGLFTYPVLMAADILMYNPDIVPVGHDQEQHIEIAREIAGKYNRAYTETFKMPKSYVIKDMGIVPGIDGEKMSKSKNNYIPIFGTDVEITKAVMSIVTDSAKPEDKKDPDTNNIYNIHKLFLNDEEKSTLRDKYLNANAKNPFGYAAAKKECAEAIINYFTPMREKYNYYKNNINEVKNILEIGAERAESRARETIKKVRLDTGLDF